jgi:hypothetical protein
MFMKMEELLKITGYEELHQFLREFLFKTEFAIYDLLNDKGLLKYLVKKELEAGVPSSIKLVNQSGSAALVSYSLTCTFFEDLEDEAGQRPNDVALGFVLRVYQYEGEEEKKIVVTRDIVSEFGDVDYPDIGYKNLTGEIKDSITGMQEQYQEVMLDFFRQTIV